MRLKLQTKLMAARKQKGWTQDKLSKVSGIPQSMIARIERGGDCRISTIELLVDKLGIELW